MRTNHSVYMHWAKTSASALYNLATSGLASIELADLKLRLEGLQLTSAESYGDPPLLESIAAHYATAQECVVTTAGASMGNHLVMAALVEPGDDVLIERPTYEPLLALARYRGANVLRFDRSANNSFALNPAEVACCLTSRTKLIVITNLHNPSGTLATESTLREIADIAQEVGAVVLVDEVYLDVASQVGARTAFHLNEAFVTTNSLTKAYGLGGLRCGWILARPDLARRLWALNDLFGVVGVHIADQLSVKCFAQLDYLASRTHEVLTTNWSVYEQFLANTPQIEVTDFRWRTTSFPRLKSGSVEQLCDTLVNKFDTSIVPGHFFEAPQHFRLGFGGNTDLFAGGLERLAKALSANRVT